MVIVETGTKSSLLGVLAYHAKPKIPVRQSGNLIQAITPDRPETATPRIRLDCNDHIQLISHNMARHLRLHKQVTLGY